MRPIFLALLAILSAPLHAQDFAFINIGGSANTDWAGMVANVPRSGGYSEFAAEWGPKFKERGYTRLWVHNPGGQWTLSNRWDNSLTWRENREGNAALHGVHLKNTRTMWLHQWEAAKWYGVEWADPRELRIFHDRMIADFGATEVCYYFGGPDHYSYELQKLLIKDFIKLEGASFGFDHITEVPEFEACHQLFKWMKRQNPEARIYTEARPYEDIPPAFTKNLDGTVATLGFDTNHPIGKLPETEERARELGEFIRIVDPDADGNYPDPIEGVTQARRAALR